MPVCLRCWKLRHENVVFDFTGQVRDPGCGHLYILCVSVAYRSRFQVNPRIDPNRSAKFLQCFYVSLCGATEGCSWAYLMSTRA